MDSVDTAYELYAVLNHTFPNSNPNEFYSGSVFDGFSTCICKSLSTGAWLYYNNDIVMKLTGRLEDQIVTSRASVLFYKRKGI